ncbi:DNA ligase 4 [Porphyridium purpureum]|uniref:DNA ligase IV n=1 Tax=Porphyridium purpureum TaxID=35688 RepID=A0A5J4Z1P3_PORPP|nr:DNA ligase 4 [Porphyridium purpureum]|eukprot:POR8356..scf208_2
MQGHVSNAESSHRVLERKDWFDEKQKVTDEVLKAFKFKHLCSLFKTFTEKSTEEKKAEMRDIFLHLKSMWQEKEPSPGRTHVPHPDETEILAGMVPACLAYPILRLLVPGLDSLRSKYGIQAKALSQIYINTMGLKGASADESWQQLLHFTDERAAGEAAGMLSEVVFKFLKERNHNILLEESDTKRQYREHRIRVWEVDQALDALAHAYKGAGAGAQARSALGNLIARCTPDENRWLVRLILKEMRLRTSEMTILKWYFPGAEVEYNSHHDLKILCEKSEEEMQKMYRTDGAYQDARRSRVILNKPFGVELSARGNSDFFEAQFKDMLKGSANAGVVIEPKYDGQRLQVHKNGKHVQLFSRNLVDENSNYAKWLAGPINAQVEAMSCVLDGEVVLWNHETDQLSKESVSMRGVGRMGSAEPFERLRSFAINNDPPSHGGTVGRQSLKFMVFDVLYLDGAVVNDRSTRRTYALDTWQVAWKPRHERKRILESIVKTDASRPDDIISIAPYEAVTSADEVREKLHEYVVDLGHEGLVMKNMSAEYAVNKRSPIVSLKLKPDYFGGGITDIDAVIIGGSYGTGERRSKMLSHFHLALLQEHAVNDDQELLFVPIGRVGTGYSDEEAGKLNLAFVHNAVDSKETGRSWRPPYLIVPGGMSLKHPDVWIRDPRRSRILTVKAYNLSRDSDGGFSGELRFPRVTNIRDPHDKAIQDIDTISDLLHRARTTSIQGPVRPLNPSGLKRKKRRVSAALDAKSGFVQGPPGRACQERKSDIFKDLKFCWLGHANKEEEVQCLVEEHGGIMLPSINARSAAEATCFLASSANNPDVQDWVRTYAQAAQGTDRRAVKIVERQGGKKDIVLLSWVERCIREHSRLQQRRHELVAMSAGTEQRINYVYDQFGDSYRLDPTQTLEEFVAILWARVERNRERFSRTGITPEMLPAVVNEEYEKIRHDPELVHFLSIIEVQANIRIDEDDDSVHA